MATTQSSSIAAAPEFTNSDTRISELLTLMHTIRDLGALGALAAWDQNTALPEGAGEIRGMQMATLQGVLHEHWTDPRLGTLLGELTDVVESADFTDADRGLAREAKRGYDQATKLPKGLVEEMARVEAGSFEAWRRARENNDFASFAPWLSRTVALQREVADRLGYAESRYDALLDLFEPGLTASQVDSLFAGVRDVSLATLKRIQASGNTVDASILEGDYASDKQVALSEKVLRAMGYDFNRGGIAVSPHPFTTEFGSPFDVRVTVHPDQRFLQAAVMAAIHEGGHALYEQGSATALARTPVAGGASMGAHESQSRLWENAIGRSEAFWRGQIHLVRETFPERFGATDAATFARALNAVKPSLIRIEADEVTYNLHIIIRFELEKALVNGEVNIETLPSLWNAKYKEYLGIEPERDAEGILQDIHWTSGFGYFPTYTLGNLYAAQIYVALRRSFPDFDERLAAGDSAFVLGWLRERMYQYGAIYLPAKLVEMVTGEPPNPAYFAEYLTSKFAGVYGL
ncbi:MAG TPA: carboxypeptidase M32 [Ktedonobacterales bacterium]|nr:carboxypeptidase M32 [Ktedonobacterales bacterium]